VTDHPQDIVLAVEIAEKLGDLVPAALEPPFAIVAWSGGADSTALLLLYRQALRLLHGTPLPEPILAVHIDHRLRHDSASDAAWCQQTAEALGPDVRLITLVIPDGDRLREMPGSLEELARLRRYGLLGQAARARGRRVVLTAHHANDNLETLILALARGAGLTGLAGIRQVIPLVALSNHPEDEPTLVVRPLLDVPREELITFLHRCDQSWRDDPTNAELDKRRNFARHRVIPTLRELADAWAPLLRAPSTLAADRRLLEELTAEALNKALRPVPQGYASGVCVARHRLLRMPPELLRHVLRMAIKRAGNPYPPDRDSLDDLAVNIVQHQGGTRAVHLRSTRVDILPDRVVLLAGDSPIYRDTPEPTVLTVPGRTTWGDFVLRATPLTLDDATAEAWLLAMRSPDAPAPPGLPDPRAAARDRHIELFDLDQLRLPLTLRAPEPGELIARFGGGTKPLARVFIDQKIPRASRLWIPIVTDAEGELLWAASVARSQRAPLEPHTRRVLLLHLMMLAS
jgi:tRNA(Ile)-lysidine synthetase-like protein